MTQTGPIITEIADGIAALGMNAPPLNILTVDLRRALRAAVDAALADRKVKLILIYSALPQFSAGGDIVEYGRGVLDPALPALCDRIEASPKPVVAVLNGAVLGGGLELALAAHYRIAAETAQFGLPEVALGLLPGAGGTQRLPRLIGAGPALDLMLTGEPIPASRAHSMGLVDRVVTDDLLRSARAYATELLAQGAGPNPTGQRQDGFADPGAYWAALRKHKAHVAKLPEALIAPRRMVHCVEAAQMLPFPQGQTLEAEAFEEVRGSDQSAAQRYAFFADRRARKAPIPSIPPRPVARVGVVGAGDQGVRIAVRLAGAGLQVHLVDRTNAALKAGLARMEALLDQDVALGRLGVRARQDLTARIASGTNLEDLAEADLVVDCVVDDFDIKSELLFKLGQVTNSACVLATTTQRFEIGALAPKTGRPEAVLGLQFHAPLHRPMGVVEVIPGLGTARDVTATGFALARRMDKTPVLASDGAGQIGARLLAAYRHAADFLLQDGANPGEIDAAMRNFGFPLGPYEALDREGLTRSLQARRAARAAADSDAAYVDIADRLAARGWLGRAAGRGYYRYPDDGSVAVECEEVAALIDAAREEKGITPRVFSEAEIVERCLLSLINEGARLLGEHVAQRPSDIDTVMRLGFGFPRWRGGPMYMADQIGLPDLAEALDMLSVEAADFWAPAALILRLVDDDKTFADLNG